jgi:hypothetical protein
MDLDEIHLVQSTISLVSSYMNLIRVDNGSSINVNTPDTWKHKVIVSAYCHLNLFDYCSVQFSVYGF